MTLGDWLPTGAGVLSFTGTVLLVLYGPAQRRVSGFLWCMARIREQFADDWSDVHQQIKDEERALSERRKAREMARRQQEATQ